MLKKILSIKNYILNRLKSAALFFHVPTILGHGTLDDEKEKQKNAARQKIESGFNSTLAAFDKVHSKASQDKEDGMSRERSIIIEARMPLKIGLFLIFGFLISFGGWLVFARLEGSVVAQGQVVFAKDKQNVQHQNGGTIKSILVREGDIVHSGQVLVSLSDVDTRANYNMTYNRIFSLKANESRLKSERNLDEKISFDSKLLEYAKDNRDLQDVINSQTRSFKANNDVFKGRIQSIIDKRIQLENEISNIESQRELINHRIKYVEERLYNAQQLLKEGGIARSQVLDLKSSRDSLKQELQRFNGSIINYGSQIKSSIEEEHATYNIRLKEIEDNLKEVGVNIAAEQEKIGTFEDSLRKNVIIAPIDGVVNNLRYHNVGDVIQPSATIMEIIPSDKYLVIEAKLMAKEINSLLNSGLDLFNYNHQEINHLLDAKINLVSYSSRRYKKLKGSVFYVAADAATDQRMGYQYYLLKVMISKKELEDASHKNMKLFPGMPAEIYILTEPRTPFSYLISPITASLDKAFIDS